MSLIVVEAICRRCASFVVLTATVSEIFGGQTNCSILVVCPTIIYSMLTKEVIFRVYFPVDDGLGAPTP